MVCRIPSVLLGAKPSLWLISLFVIPKANLPEVQDLQDPFRRFYCHNHTLIIRQAIPVRIL